VVNGKVTGFTAACVLVSNVIGSGIFTTTGFMARDLGDPWLILLLWTVGALLALTGALSYSELGAAIPQVGGEYLYLRHAYGPLWGFLSGWASFVVGFSAAIAAGSVSFAAYLLQVLPFSHEPGPAATVLALALVWVLTGTHMAGVETGGVLQRLLTLTKVAAILALVAGAFLVGRGDWGHLTVRAPSTAPGLGTVVVSLIFVIYAYSGWNAAGYIAGEVADPGRAIPRSMIRGTLFVGVVYLLLNVVYLYALPVAALAQPPLLPVAEKAAVALFGTVGAALVSILLCISIAAAVSAMVWAGPRVYVAMARDGILPAGLAEARGAGGAPSRAILLQSGWATVLILSGSFEQLVVYTGLVLTLFSALAVGAVIVLRRKRPDLTRPFRVPLYPFVPVVYLAIAATVILYAVVERPVESAWGVATVLAGVPLYWLHGRRPQQA